MEACRFAVRRTKYCLHTMVWMIAILAIILCVSVGAVSEPFECPGCLKVLKAVKEMSISMNNQDKTSISLSAALDKYCALSALDVDDQQFCYNIETMRGDINRLLDMGADETRVCKKVRSINPHFCSGEKKQSKEKKTVHVNQSQRKGIIFS